MLRYIIYLTFCIFIFTIHTYSNELKIISDNLEVNRIDQTSVFTGNVYAHNQDLKIWAEKLIISYSETDSEIKQINAENKVRIKKDEITATGDTGVYFPITDQVNIYGNVEVFEKDNFVKCDELNIDIKQSTSIMKSNSSKRVEAYINTN